MTDLVKAGAAAAPASTTILRLPALLRPLAEDVNRHPMEWTDGRMTIRGLSTLPSSTKPMIEAEIARLKSSICRDRTAMEREVASILAMIRANYFQRPVNEAQARRMAEEWIEDVCEAPVVLEDVQAAWRTWRRTKTNAPTPADFRALARSSAAKREALLRRLEIMRDAASADQDLGAVG